MAINNTCAPFCEADQMPNALPWRSGATVCDRLGVSVAITTAVPVATQEMPAKGGTATGARASAKNPAAAEAHPTASQ